MRRFLGGSNMPPLILSMFTYGLIMAAVAIVRYTETSRLMSFIGGVWVAEAKIFTVLSCASFAWGIVMLCAHRSIRNQLHAEFDDQLWEHTAEVNPERLALFPAHPADAVTAKFLDTREYEGAWAVQVQTEDKKKWWFRVDAKTRHRFIVPGTYVVIPKDTPLVPDPNEA